MTTLARARGQPANPAPDLTERTPAMALTIRGRDPLEGVDMNSIGIATLRPGKYEVAKGDHKIGTIWGDYAIGFRPALIDGTVIGAAYPTPDDAAEALAAHVAFVAVVDEIAL